MSAAMRIDERVDMNLGNMLQPGLNSTGNRGEGGRRAPISPISAAHRVVDLLSRARPCALRRFYHQFVYDMVYYMNALSFSDRIALQTDNG